MSVAALYLLRLLPNDNRVCEGVCRYGRSERVLITVGECGCAWVGVSEWGWVLVKVDGCEVWVDVTWVAYVWVDMEHM